MASFTIREAIREDLPDLMRIYNIAVRDTTATFDLEEQTLEEREAWFAHYGGPHPLLTAVMDDGRIAGYGSLSMFRAKPAYDRTVENSIYLDPDCWGMGIGKAMLAELIRRAKELGHHAMIACITDGNDTSVRLHKQFGFESAGNLREVGYKFGKWQSVTFFELLLE
jgi:phosphinothricin acetyltransferase